MTHGPPSAPWAAGYGEGAPCGAPFWPSEKTRRSATTSDAGFPDSRAGSQRLWQGLRDRAGVEPLFQDFPPASGLVSFTVPGHDPQRLVTALARRGLHLRMLADPPCLRACTHVVTTDGDIDALLEQLDALLTSGQTA